MNTISVKVTYPTLHQLPLSTPPPTPTPVTRSQSLLHNRVPSQKGIVGYYDIHELNEEIRLFGISDETRNALLRKRHMATRKVPKTAASGKTYSLTRDSCLNSRDDSREFLVRHSAAARNCYVDFSGNFRDSIRAQSVKMTTKDSAVHSNFSQRMIPITLQTPKRKKRTKKEISSSVPVHIREGLLVIDNGQVVDLSKDIKDSAKLKDKERQRLRKEMREHLDIVRSFDNILEKFDTTKMQIEQLKRM